MYTSADENRNHINEILNLMQATCAGGHQSILTKSAFWISTRLLTLSNNVWSKVEFWLNNSNIPEMAEHAMVYLMEHPPIALLVGVFLLASGFPLIIFLVFAVVSTIVTFIGFLLVEGTILTVAAFILVSVLLGMLITAVFIAAVCAAAYLSFVKLSSSFSAFLGTPAAVVPPSPQPDQFTPPRVSRLRRGSAFFTAVPHAHQHDIFSLSHRSPYGH